MEGFWDRFSWSEARRLTDRLLASDPSFGRLRDAFRIILVAAASALVSFPIVSGGSAVAPLFGAVVGLLATMAVRDDGLGRQRITTLLLFAPAALSATLGALLSSVAWLQGMALLIFVFLALYLRRFGPRYAALGMVALIPLFLSSFVGYGVGQLPWILVSAAVGILCAYAFRFFLLPDRSQGVLRRSVAAFGVQLGLTLDAVADTIEDRQSNEKRRKRLRREADRLNEIATATEGLLSAEDVGVSREHSERLRLYLFDAEMSANTLSEVAWRYAASERVPPEVQSSLLRALRELRATLPSNEGLPSDSEGVSCSLDDLRRERERAEDGDATGWSFLARRAEAALRQLSEDVEERREHAPRKAEPVEAEDGKEEDGEEKEDRSRQRGGIAGKLRPTTVQGIQAALAAGLGLLAGQVVSPSRPYWVVITAFVVFMGSGTLGDTISRGVQRAVGTLLGAVVGLLLASLVSGNLYLEVPLIVACVFLAFYLFPVSQALMIFWITVMLALVFDLIGQLTGGILVLRVVDTLVGGAIGLAVSALVLPTRTGDEIRENTIDFLGALKGYLHERVDWLAGGEAPRRAVEEAREVDDKLRTITQNAATARNQALLFGHSKTDLDRFVTVLMALTYHARHLAGPVNRSQRLEDADRGGELLKEIGERIEGNISSLEDYLSDGRRPEVRDVEDLMERLEGEIGERTTRGDREAAEGVTSAGPDTTASPVPGQAGPSDALHHLRRINRTLCELSKTPGVGGNKRVGVLA